MDHFSDQFSGLHSSDDFDLLSLGILPQEDPTPEPEDDEEPHINPLHDMDSLEFLLWVEQEARNEKARRAKAAEAAAQNKAEDHTDAPAPSPSEVP